MESTIDQTDKTKVANKSISINNIPADFPEEQLKALVENFGSVKKWDFNAQFKFAKVAFASEKS